MISVLVTRARELTRTSVEWQLMKFSRAASSASENLDFLELMHSNANGRPVPGKKERRVKLEKKCD